MSRNKDKKPRVKSHPLVWFGGKYWLGEKIDRLYTPAHKIYVEPFAGGSHVFFRKEPAGLEVLNDMDSGLVNFYRVLRDPDQFSKFQRMAELSLYSREEFEECQSNWMKYKNPVKRAWAWYINHRHAWGGMPDKGFAIAVKSSGVMSESAADYLNGLERLPNTHARLRMAQIEHKDFAWVINKHDTPETFFYCDPPYVWDTRVSGVYACEMSDGAHLDLVDMLLDIQGMCLLSGYDNDIYLPLEVAGWKRKVIKVNSPTGKTPREEVLWFSPNLLVALWAEGKCLELREDIEETKLTS